MLRKSKGRNKDSGVKWLVMNKIGRKLTIPAENKDAFSLLVIFLLIKKIEIVKVDNKRLGSIFATIVIGRIKLKKAMK